MEGKTAVDGISTLLKREGIERYSSVGSISESLTFIGEFLPSTQFLSINKEIKVRLNKIIFLDLKIGSKSYFCYRPNIQL